MIAENLTGPSLLKRRSESTGKIGARRIMGQQAEKIWFLPTMGRNLGGVKAPFCCVRIGGRQS